MNIPHIPSAAYNDPAHFELIMILMIVVVFIMTRMWWHERRKNDSEEERWVDRIEDKLDRTIGAHDQCQKDMPFKYVTKEEFRDLLKERNRQWTEFNDKFDKLIDRFWNHCHDHNGKVERQ
jgi:hypothetical protein